jgi:NADPH-dependent F420 reductase
MTVEAVAILGGTGPQGRGLALRFARAGAPVTIGSRDAERAHAAADALGFGITGAANPEAARSADVVFVSVPWDAHHATLASLRAELAGRIVVDLVNPMVFDEAGPVGLPVVEGSAAQQAAALLPESTIVSGFHHVSAKLLLDDAQDVDEDIMICGDDAAAKERVLTLAQLIPGVRAVDTGPLRLASFLEGMTCVLLSVNRAYRATTGIRLTRLDPARRRST